ncbi:sporulation protein YpjB [Thermoflavimicrobium dichotomicum]|uniref:Sporulation protein YpjB n=1 Tax=Thermoflavimicrobium dichotomicum TaxID=46223 RepID=A0A1I3SJY8_9BACL|nr:sporulation protein YpjB [Thermoflavimicrobium dichotomicum]SFJ59015.1 sporulation protein YpjB [Thermoflavimicrobium dichotomicum]
MSPPRIMQWLVFIGMCFFTFLPMAQANEGFHEQSEEWSKKALQISKWIEQREFRLAKEELTQLATQFATADFSNKKLNVAAIRALSEAILDVEHELNRVMLNEAKLKKAAIRLSIAFDAMSHSHQPLWKQYYDSFKNQLQRLKKTLADRNQGKIRQQIEQFAQDYDIIRPALIIAKSEQTVQKLDSLFTALRKTEDQELMKASIEELDRILYPLFFGTEKDVMAVIAPFGSLPFYWILCWISGFIILVLSYVGWRKYQSEEVMQKA